MVLAIDALAATELPTFGAGTTPNHIEIGFRFPIDNNFIEAMAMMAALGICTYVTVNPNAFCRQADRGSLSETDDCKCALADFCTCVAAPCS